MMHLPALVISNQMEKVVRAVNQLGIAVRGLFGEGSDASGSIFQISNQTTLGESEEAIIRRLSSVLKTIIDQEINAREKILEIDPNKLLDKIGRAYGILQNSHLLSSSECMNLVSLVRFGSIWRCFRRKCGILSIDCSSNVNRVTFSIMLASRSILANGMPTDPNIYANNLRMSTNL